MTRTRPDEKELPTHYVEDTGYRQRSYMAICGATIHAREMNIRSSPLPTCPKCKALLETLETLEF